MIEWVYGSVRCPLLSILSDYTPLQLSAQDKRGTVLFSKMRGCILPSYNLPQHGVVLSKIWVWLRSNSRVKV